MNALKSIQRAAQGLSADQLVEFRRWIAEFDAAAWDAQLDRDAKAGSLNALAIVHRS